MICIKIQTLTDNSVVTGSKSFWHWLLHWQFMQHVYTNTYAVRFCLTKLLFPSLTSYLDCWNEISYRLEALPGAQQTVSKH